MNKLFYGDNLDVLRKFIRDETVDLCYINPPFNSKRNYNQIYNNIGSEDRAQARRLLTLGRGTPRQPLFRRDSDE
jgi:DNA modification methylase